MSALNLATLPLDVLEPVVSNLEQRDVKQLSLTCSALRQATMPELFSTYFAALAGREQAGQCAVDAAKALRYLRAKPQASFGTKGAGQDPTCGSYVRRLSIDLDTSSPFLKRCMEDEYDSYDEDASWDEFDDEELAFIARTGEIPTKNGVKEAKRFSRSAQHVGEFLRVLALVLKACPNVKSLELSCCSISNSVIGKVTRELDHIKQILRGLDKLESFSYSAEKGVEDDGWFELLLPHLPASARTLDIGVRLAATARDPFDKPGEGPATVPRYNVDILKINNGDEVLASEAHPFAALASRLLARAPDVHYVELSSWITTVDLIASVCFPLGLRRLSLRAADWSRVNNNPVPALKAAATLRHVTIVQTCDNRGFGHASSLLTQLPADIEILEVAIGSSPGSESSTIALNKLVESLEDVTWLPHLRYLSVDCGSLLWSKHYEKGAASRSQLEQAIKSRGGPLIQLRGNLFTRELFPLLLSHADVGDDTDFRRGDCPERAPVLGAAHYCTSARVTRGSHRISGKAGERD
jgi:hypothetical protein